MKKFFRISLLTLSLGILALSASSFTSTDAISVTNREVITYLNGKGYSNVVVLQIYQDGSRLCDTSNPYHTMVYVSGDAIVGNEDIHE